MTDRDDLRAVIREVLAEQREHRGYSRRDPLVRFADPEGKSWYSATVSKLQALSLLLTLLGMIGGVVWGSMSMRDRLVVFPEVAARIQEHDLAPGSHNGVIHAIRMDAMTASAKNAEITAQRNEQIKTINENIVDLKRQNEILNEKLDRLLARR